MPRLDGVLETAVYVDDVARARGFYEGVLGLRPVFADERLTAYEVAPRSMLLVFRRGASTETAHQPGGTIPPHDGAGPLHLAFAIGAEELPAWLRHFEVAGIPIEGRTRWPRGGESLYVRDPDGHLVELATPGLWPGY